MKKSEEKMKKLLQLPIINTIFFVKKARKIFFFNE